MKSPSIRVPTWRMGILSAPGWAIGFFLLLFAGCSYLEPTPEPAVPSVFDNGLAVLADGDFAGAESAFRRAASRCESGSDGQRALLFLSFLGLDPRNPVAHPDSAALMAARFLNLPGLTREETLEAEALYITALDYGADPELRIDPVNPGFAVRFGDCDQPFPPRDDRPLPTLDSPTSGLLRSLDEERGTLTQENQQLRYTVRQLRHVSDSLQTQMDTLEVELNRIRRLIRLPDTMVARPPDTGLVRPPDTGLVRSPDATLFLILGTDPLWLSPRP
jgi:hypothetical protein